MKRTKLGVCVVGTGRAGLIHAQNYAERIPNAELVALVDARKESVAAACAQTGVEKYYLNYRDALEDKHIDAIVVVTPTVSHHQIVVDAAHAGKHVLCEKPMAMNTAECDSMIAATDKAGVVLQIGFMRRFDEGFRQAKSRIGAGEIGEVVLVKSLTHGPSHPRPWQFDIKASNGPLAEVNSHDIDTLRWFSCSEIESVYALAGNYRCPEVRKTHPDFYDSVTLLASLQNGSQGFVDGAVSVGYGYDCRVEILGTKGLLFVGRVQQNGTVICTAERGVVQNCVVSWRDLFDRAYVDEDQAFVNAVLNESPAAVTGQDGKAAVQVVMAGNRSIVEHKPVTVVH